MYDGRVGQCVVLGIVLVGGSLVESKILTIIMSPTIGAASVGCVCATRQGTDDYTSATRTGAIATGKETSGKAWMMIRFFAGR